MNSEFSEPMDAGLLQIERELRSLSPIAPDRALSEMLAREVAGEMEVPVAGRVNRVVAGQFPWRRVGVPTAAAAAAAVFVLPSAERPVDNGSVAGGIRSAEEARPGHAPISWVPMPPRSEYRLVDGSGVLLINEPAPMMEYQLEQTEHHEWRNPRDNSLIRMSIPRQQRVLLPASYR
jgi:hypothetical protein